jgi:hypothetical protein
MYRVRPIHQASSAVYAECSGGPEDVRPHLSGDMAPAVLDYWERLRGKRRFPARADFNPMDIRKQLPFVNLIDALPDGTFRYRVVGGMIAEFFGPGSPVGRTPQEVFGENAEVALAPLRLVCAERCLCMHAASASWIHEARNYVRYEILLLPFGDSEARVDKILGVVDFMTEEAAGA